MVPAGTAQRGTLRFHEKSLPRRVDPHLPAKLIGKGLSITSPASQTGPRSEIFTMIAPRAQVPQAGQARLPLPLGKVGRGVLTASRPSPGSDVAAGEIDHANEGGGARGQG